MSIKLYKAEPLGGEPVPDLRLEFVETIPLPSADLPSAQRQYREQAKEIVRLMSQSLPGGTMHALLVELLESKASLLRVPE